MKTISVSLLAAGLLLPGSAFAERPEGRGDERPEVPPRAEEPVFDEAWKRADTDGDGRISREEFEAMPRIQHLPADKRDNLFDRLDKNGDGFISPGEVLRRGRGRGEHRMPNFAELDTDNSGGVSFEEFIAGEFFSKLTPEKQRALFDRLDTDGDGQITPKDRPEPPRRHEGRPGPRQLIRLLDQDGDGALTFEEFAKAPFLAELDEEEKKARFDRLDRNNDGRISEADFPVPREREEERERD